MRSGDEDAISRLLTDFGAALYGYLYRATGSEAKAEKAFLSLTERLVDSPYQGSSEHFVGWLYQLAVVAARAQGLGLTQNEGAPTILRSLPRELWEVFLLSHYEKLTPEQISIALQITRDEAAELVERAVAAIFSQN